MSETDSDESVQAAARRGRRALDWLNFFIADVQTGFGPFIAVYLVTRQWTESQIGFALSVGTFTAMISQVPAGALVDAIAAKRGIALAALLALAVSALTFALWPATLPVLLAEVAHGFASCLFVPAASAISLALVGHAALGERLGRNARFKAIGNGLSAALMGAVGTYVSGAAVFWLTAALTVPAMAALALMPRAALRYREEVEEAQDWKEGVRRLAANRGVLVFAGYNALFGLANAAMLPLAGTEITALAGERANLLIAASIVVPQIIVAALSPWVGRAANRHGRRPLLVLCCAAVALRGFVLALLIGWPMLLVPIQALDGVSAAAMGVLLPLLAADLTRGTNRFNLCIGVFGLANGLGATLSTSLAGLIADHVSTSAAFLALAGAGLCGVALTWFVMPETRPARKAYAGAAAPEAA